MTGENFETTTVEEISTVEVCDSCGTDLSDIEPSAREQRVLRDIKFTGCRPKGRRGNQGLPRVPRPNQGAFS